MAILVTPAFAQGRIDSQLSTARNRQPGQLRWQNLESAPQWVAGVEPRRFAGHRMHLVQLAPGKSVTFRVPPRSMVRVHHPQRRLQLDDVDLWVSNGSGLYRRQIAAISANGRSLLAAPDQRHTCLARVARGGDHRSAISVAVFTSHSEVLDPMEPYRTAGELRLTVPEVRLRRDDEQRGAAFYRLDTDREPVISLVGPRQLAIQTRYRYRPQESRSFQSYRLTATLDGRPFRQYELETTSELRHRIYEGERLTVVGQVETVYLRIPPGEHKLRLATTGPVYLRIRQRATAADYLLPRINGPPAEVVAAPAGGLFRDTVAGWDVAPEAIREFSTAAGIELFEREQLAMRAARDNSHRDGGLRGTMLMRLAAALHPDDSQVRVIADKLQRHHTFYRNLIPLRKSAASEPRVGWFSNRRMLDGGETYRDLVLAEQHVADSLRAVYQASFVAVGDSPAAATVYRLPAQRGRTLLRVVIDRDSVRGVSELLLQYDDRSPVVLLGVQRAELPETEYLPSRGEAALAVLRSHEGSLGRGTIGGSFVRERLAAAPVRAATIQLILPPDVGKVRVWTRSSHPSAPRVALQYLAAKPFRLSEAEYLAMWSAARDENLSLRQLLNSRGAAEADQPASRELLNHWVPLARLLKSHQDNFESTVAHRTIRTQVAGGWRATSKEQVESARQWADDEQWLPALEAWSAVRAGGSDEQRREAVLGQYQSLLKLGEHFLAVRSLRSVFLDDDDALARRAAMNTLVERAAETQDIDRWEELLAVAALREPRAEDLAELAEVFMKNGRVDFAMLMCLALPPQHRPLELQLQAALALRWWKVFEYTLAKLPSDQQNYWRGHRLLAEGHYPQATRRFRQGGPRGAAVAEHLAWGRRILERLNSRSLQQRCRAVLEWERWQAEHPGPKVWREEANTVTDYAGSEAVYSRGRDLFARYYTARPNRPVTLRVHGPATLKLAMRPIHAADTTGPVDGWIQFRSQGLRVPIPVSGDRPSSGLRISGDDDRVPGRQVDHVWRLGPGLHELEVASPNFELLVRPFVRRPEMPIPLLPSLHADTLASFLHRNPAARFTEPTAEVHLMAGGRELADRAVPLAETRARPLSRQVDVERVGDGLLAARIALRTGQPLDESLRQRLRRWAVGQVSSDDEWRTAESETDGADERLLALFRSTDEVDRESLDALDRQVSLRPEVRHAAYLAAGLDETALQLPWTTDAEAAVRRMVNILELSEQYPERAEQWLGWGGAVFAAERSDERIARLFGRLSQSARWRAIRDVTRSAGVHAVPLGRWLPEAPLLRVRRALIDDLSPHDHILFGHQEMVLALQNVEPAKLDLTIQCLALPFLPATSLTLKWQIDDHESEEVSLSPNGKEHFLTLEIPKGEHEVRFWVAQPFANHYLRVNVTETVGQDSRSVEVPDSSFEDGERFYHVADRDEPLEIRLAGPCLVRLDQWRDGTVLSRYVEVPEGKQTLTFEPQAGQDESLYRVFVLEIPDKEIHSVPSFWEPTDVDEVAKPLLKDESNDEELLAQYSDQTRNVSYTRALSPLAVLSPDAPILQVDTLDESPLGGHEDPPWAFQMGVFRRRPLEENLGAGVPGEFLEFRLTRQYLNPWSDTHQRSDWYLRARDHSGPTLGMQYRLRRSWSEHHAFGDLDIAALTQWPGGPLPTRSARTEWAFQFRGRLTQRRDLNEDTFHMPSARLFARALSMSGSRYQPGRVDQDVFTPYKANHRFGLALADTLVHYPWLDTRWWLRPSLVTNEDFNIVQPDHLSLRTGWTQALGIWELEASYRVTRFLADSDRRRDSTQHVLYLDAVAERWRLGPHHSEVALHVAHDMSSGTTSANLTAAFLLEPGKTNRHRWPGQSVFDNLRQRHEARRKAGPVTDSDVDRATPEP